MQIFELILVLASLILLLFPRLIAGQLKKSYSTGLLGAILLLHLVLEGYRWQMIPGYFLWALALFSALRPATEKPKLVFRILKVFGLLLLLVPTFTLPSILPVFDLPEPTGTYTVGTTDLLLETGRLEEITQNRTDERRLMVKAWYPSNASGGEMDPYVDQGGRNGFAIKYGLPPSSMNYLDKVDTHVFKNVDLAQGSFPVLIFSHGYHSKANGYYALLSEIASQGYVVLALNHTFESTGSTFPDQSEVYFDQPYAQKIEEGTWEMMGPIAATFHTDMTFDERHPMVKEGLKTYFVRDIVERWADDIVDLDKALDQWNQNDFFQGRLDLDKIGVFGHSRGGGAAGEALLRESRIKAGINLDGVQWGQIVETSFDKPFLFLSADWPPEHEDMNQHAYVNKSRKVFYEGMILQSGHSNFMDIPFMIPLEALSQAGSVDPHLAMEITTRSVLTFFDKHLQNKPVDMLELGEAYPMLDMKVYKGSEMELSQLDSETESADMAEIKK